MSRTPRAQLVGWWFAAIIVLFAISVVEGAPTTMGVVELWMAAFLVPPAVMLLIWRGAATMTRAELIHAVNSSERS